MRGRKSNIELLRIVLMIMIISLHYLNPDMGGALKYSEGTNYYITRLLESLFIVAVNGFILITGYCCVKKETTNINKLVKLFFDIIIYGLIIQFTLVLFGQVEFSIKDFVKNFIPISNDGYWFFKVYIMLFLIMPFINIVLRKLDKNRYEKMIIVLLIIFSIWDSISPFKLIGGNGYSLINFVLLYCIGGYLRIHYQNNSSFSKWIILYFVFGVITFISLFIPVIKDNSWNYYFITNILSVICLFNAFIKIDINSKIINKIASSVFGVFILHLNPYILELQYKIFKTDLFWNSKYIVIHMLVTCIVLFIIFTLIDMFKKILLDKYEENLIKKIKIFNIEI